MKATVKNPCVGTRKDALRALNVETLRGLARLVKIPQKGTKEALVGRLEACNDIVIQTEARIGIRAPGDADLVGGENPSLEHYRQQQEWLKHAEVVESAVPIGRRPIKRNAE